LKKKLNKTVRHRSTNNGPRQNSEAKKREKRADQEETKPKSIKKEHKNVEHRNSKTTKQLPAKLKKEKHRVGGGRGRGQKKKKWFQGKMRKGQVWEKTKSQTNPGNKLFVEVEL